MKLLPILFMLKSFVAFAQNDTIPFLPIRKIDTLRSYYDLLCKLESPNYIYQVGNQTFDLRKNKEYPIVVIDGIAYSSYTEEEYRKALDFVKVGDIVGFEVVKQNGIGHFQTVRSVIVITTKKSKKNRKILRG
jgi:hypothetical protein